MHHLATMCAEALRPSGVRESARRVLVVEDDDDSRELLGMILSRKGYAVQLAASATEALEVAAAFVPEVVLADIGLPDLDGCELAGRLRALPELKACHLVAVTGYTGADAALRIKQAGFAAAIIKPVDFEAVIAAVEGAELARVATG